MSDLTITQIPAVLTAFHRRLAAVSAFAVEQAPVDLGWPTGGPKPRHVWIDGSVDSWEQDWLTTVQGDPAYSPAFEESFTVTVNVLWSKAKAEFGDLMSTAFDLAAEVDQVVVDDFTIDGTADSVRPIGGDFSEDFSTDRGRRILIQRRFAVVTSSPRG